MINAILSACRNDFQRIRESVDLGVHL
jgi:hypothetical protein